MSLRKAPAALFATLLFGVGYPAVKLTYRYFGIASSDIPSKLLLAGIRFLAAGALTFLLGWAIRRRPCLPRRRHLGGVALLALFQTVLQYGFTYIGLATAGSAKSAVLNQANVFLLVLLTPLLIRSERFYPRKLLGCLLGFAGIVIINLDGLGFSFCFGDGMILLASVSAAVGYLISRAITQSDDVFAVTAAQQALGGAVLFLAGLLRGGKFSSVNASGILWLLFLAAAASGAYTLWVMLLRSGEVSDVAVWKFMTPVFGVLASGILLGESIFSLGNLIALLLVAAGIFLANRRTKKSLAQPLSPTDK